MSAAYISTPPASASSNTVPNGGTGASSFTANGTIVAGPTSTSPLTSAAPGTAGFVLTSNGAALPPTYQAAPAGTGDVVGPASATDSQLAFFSSTTGKLLKAAMGTNATTAPTLPLGTVTDTTNRGLTISYTVNNSGLTAVPLIVRVTETASAAASACQQWFGGAAGTTLRAQIDKDGTFNTAAGFTGAAGVVSSVAGTLATPTYSFTGNLNYGMYLASSELRWAVNGVLKMQLTSTQLIVSNNINTVDILCSNLNATGTTTIGTAGSAAKISSNGSGLLQLTNNGATAGVTLRTTTADTLDIRKLDNSAAGGLTASDLTLSASLTVGTSIGLGAAQDITWSARAKLRSSADSKVKIVNNGGTTGVTLDVSTDGKLLVRNFADGADGIIQGSNLISTTTVRLKGYTVATLPAGTAGDTAYVTDAAAPAFLVAVVGGGAVVSTVFYNGTAWVAQ